MTPLMMAAKDGEYEMVKMFVDEGKAVVGLKDNAGKTALDYAKEEGHVIIERYLEHARFQKT